jgi:hypothetical protein
MKTDVTDMETHRDARNVAEKLVPTNSYKTGTTINYKPRDVVTSADKKKSDSCSETSGGFLPIRWWISGKSHDTADRTATE